MSITATCRNRSLSVSQCESRDNCYRGVDTFPRNRRIIHWPPINQSIYERKFEQMKIPKKKFDRPNVAFWKGIEWVGLRCSFNKRSSNHETNWISVVASIVWFRSSSECKQITENKNLLSNGHLNNKWKKDKRKMAKSVQRPRHYMHNQIIINYHTWLGVRYF